MSSYTISNPRFQIPNAQPYALYARAADGKVGQVVPGDADTVLTSNGSYAPPTFKAVPVAASVGISAVTDAGTPINIDGTTADPSVFQPVKPWVVPAGYEFNQGMTFSETTGEIEIITAGKYNVEGIFTFANAQMDRTCVLELSFNNGSSWTVMDSDQTVGNTRTGYIQPGNVGSTVSLPLKNRVGRVLSLKNGDLLRLGVRVDNSAGVASFNVLFNGLFNTALGFVGQKLTTNETGLIRGPTLEVIQVSDPSYSLTTSAMEFKTVDYVSYISDFGYGDAASPTGVNVDSVPTAGGTGYEVDREYVATGGTSTPYPFKVVVTSVDPGGVVTGVLTSDHGGFLPGVGSRRLVQHFWARFGWTGNGASEWVCDGSIAGFEHVWHARGCRYRLRSC